MSSIQGLEGYNRIVVVVVLFLDLGLIDLSKGSLAQEALKCVPILDAKGILALVVARFRRYYGTCPTGALFRRRPASEFSRRRRRLVATTLR